MRRYIISEKRPIGGMKSDLLPDSVEEIHVRLIRRPSTPLREDLGSVTELAASIFENGLLEPLVVRPVDGKFEVVAGSRRLEACKLAGVRKVLCHVIELDDKQAFEVALTENVQRRTLNPVDEARAFERYVTTYGYGGESELARRIGKSQQYVSQRIRLLSLPDDLLDRVTRRLVSLSQAVELLGLEEDEQRTITEVMAHEDISSRSVRKLARELKDLRESEEPFLASENTDAVRRPLTIVRKCIEILRASLIRLDDVIQHLDEDEWVLKESLLVHRTAVHEQIDGLYKLRDKLSRTGKGASFVLLSPARHPQLGARERASLRADSK
jgi:ParB family chromosome partitioning protein